MPIVPEKAGPFSNISLTKYIWKEFERAKFSSPDKYPESELTYEWKISVNFQDFTETGSSWDSIESSV